MGFLIARHEASGKHLVFTNEHGDQVRLWIPEITAEVVAEEDITLRP